MLYLSGKITDSDLEIQEQNLQRFFDKEKELGVRCHNPAKLGAEDHPYEWYLARDVAYIVRNRPILYMMKGWEDSRGARLEHELGVQLGLRIDYE